MQGSPLLPFMPGASSDPMSENRPQPESDSLDADRIVWAASGGAVRILASRPLLEELRAAAYRARFGSRRAGVEIGGVLYGRRSPVGVELRGWVSIDCAWSFGPSFHLSDREQGTLACLLDGLAERLSSEGNEVLGWFVSRIRGERAPTPSDIELHRQFFPTTGSLLLVLQPRREGDVWTTVHVYDGENRQLTPCDPMWVIDPALLPAGDRNAASPAAVGRRGRARASSEEWQQPADDAIPPPASGSPPAVRSPAATRQPRGGRAAAPLSQLGGVWDSVPHNVWLLLALGIVLAIAGAAWLWLFQSDVVRPLLLRWTSSASAPPRSVLLTAKLDRDRLTVEWDGRSPVFLNPMSAELVFEFAAAEPTTVPLRPDEGQRGYFTTLTSLPPSRVTMIVIPAPGREFKQTFSFPAPDNGQPEAPGAAIQPGPPNLPPKR